MKALIFIIALFSGASTLAAPYPVASDVKVYLKGGTYTFDITWSVIDIPDADRVVKAGMMFSKPYVLILAKRPSTGVTHAFKIGGGTSLGGLVPTDTISKVAMAYYNKGIITGGWYDLDSADPVGACVAVGFVQSQSGNIKNVWDISSGACTNFPPPEASCTITTPSVTLAHGMLVRGSGLSTAEGDIEIECSRATNINIKFIADGMVKLSNGETAMLSAKSFNGGKNGNSRLPAGRSTVKIGSDIYISQKTPEGNFMGNSVVYINYL
jgi:hypothetical protein